LLLKFAASPYKHVSNRDGSKFTDTVDMFTPVAQCTAV